MPKATNTPATSRRTALHGDLSIIAARLFGPQAISAVPTDAELIRLCVVIHANRDAMDALLETRVTIEDEHRTEPALTRLFEAEKAVLNQIWEVGTPDTAHGAKAVALTALRLAGAGEVEQPELLDDAGWLAVDALRFLVGS